MMEEVLYSTGVRLTRQEVGHIRVGLGRMIAAHALWKKHNQFPHSHPKALFPEEGFDLGQYATDCWAAVGRAWEKIETVTGTTKRMRMDPFELAACVLGVRVAATRVRHRHREPWRRNQKAATRNLLRKLENLRKQAKRSFAAARGSRAFAEASHRWKRFVRWVRMHFLYCGCGQSQLPAPNCSRRRLRKLQIQDWVAFIREQFPRDGLEVPEEELLTELVRRAFRSWLRRQRKYGFRLGRETRELANEHIIDFVWWRCKQLEWAAAEKADALEAAEYARELARKGRTDEEDCQKEIARQEDQSDRKAEERLETSEAS